MPVSRGDGVVMSLYQEQWGAVTALLARPMTQLCMFAAETQVIRWWHYCARCTWNGVWQSIWPKAQWPGSSGGGLSASVSGWPRNGRSNVVWQPNCGRSIHSGSGNLLGVRGRSMAEVVEKLRSYVFG